MYYRVALKVDSSPRWQWKSTVLNELLTVFQWLRLYRALPHDRMRIFSGSSLEEMNDQLGRENQGLGSSSVTAAQFLQGKLLRPEGVIQDASVNRAAGYTPAAPSAIFSTSQSRGSSSQASILDEKGGHFLEKRRVELEHGTGGDHDVPYRFTLPTSMPQVLAWVRLLRRVQQGEVQP